MFGWLKRKAQIAQIKMKDTDLDRFLQSLRGASSNEIGYIVAVAAHWRNYLEVEFDWDLDHPDEVAYQNPGAALGVNRLIRQLQKEGKEALAPGMMVWLHTLRASDTPELRLKGREMWAQLRRGFPYVDQAAEDMQLAGIILDNDGANRIPETLQPDFD